MFIYSSSDGHVLIARTFSEYMEMTDSRFYINLMNGYVDSKYTSIRHALEDPHIHDVCALAEFIACADHNACSSEYWFLLRDLNRPSPEYNISAYDKPCIIHTPEDILILNYPKASELVGIAKDLLQVLRATNSKEQHRSYYLTRREIELSSIVENRTGCVSGPFPVKTTERVMKYLRNFYSDIHASITTPTEDIQRVAMSAKDWRNYAKVCVVWF